MEKLARAKMVKKRPPPNSFAYWRVFDPHKLYISGKVMENTDQSAGLDFCPTPQGGDRGQKT